MSPRFLTRAALLGALAVLQPYRLYFVSGDSMSPTFKSGQLLVGNARPRRVSRGDVVVFRKGTETMVKRVAYLPKDRLDQFYVVGEWQAAVSDRTYRSMLSKKYRRRDYVVPEGTLYVIGDNAYDSVDSRSYGPIDVSDVIAVVPGKGSADFPWFVGVRETAQVVVSL